MLWQAKKKLGQRRHKRKFIPLYIGFAAIFFYFGLASDMNGFSFGSSQRYLPFK
jgi:hypothetical protein